MPSLSTKFFVRFFVVVVVLACGPELRDIASVAGLTLPRFPFPFGRSLVDNLLMVLLAVICAALLSPTRGGHVVDKLGLRWRGWKAPALTLLATGPGWTGLGWTGKIATHFVFRSLRFLALIFPLAEEISFRGFGFIFIRRYLRSHI